MYKFVTRYHFSSRDTCEASARSNVSLGDYHCNEPPVSPAALASYHSVKPLHGKLPFACYTTSPSRTPTDESRVLDTPTAESTAVLGSPWYPNRKGTKLNVSSSGVLTWEPMEK